MKNSTPLEAARSSEVGVFPFRCEFSLRQLIAWWEAAAAGGDPLASRVVEQLASAPELRAPSIDRAVLERHRPVVDLLMSAVFPPARRDVEAGAALVPFKLQAMYATPPMARLIAGADGFLDGVVNMDARTGVAYRILHAYAHVLRVHYGITLDLEYPLVVSVSDPDSGRERHFKMSFDDRFETLETVGEAPVLTEEMRRRLLANLSDPAVMMELLPPERFVFRGLTIFTATEVTDHELLSALQRDLIERESIVSTESFERLEGRLRAFFRRPALHLGLAALHGDQVYILSHTSHMKEGCIFADSAHYPKERFVGSIYERAAGTTEPLIIEDLRAWPAATTVEQNFLDMGHRSLVLAPLRDHGEVIGILTLLSDQPGDFNATHGFRLREVLPLFAVAVKRSMDELNSRVQAVIKEKCTAIHPTVEWRFRRAVLHGIERRHGGGLDADFEMEPIVFDAVHPLYGLADIRGSSTQRTLAVQADLLAQLRLARDVVEAAYRARRLPALHELTYRIDKEMSHIEQALRSGDEQAVTAFVHHDVEPLFAEVAGFGGAVRDRVAAYRAALDPQLATVYQRRRLVDESMTRLTEALSAYLELEEQVAQEMWPHYFEKQKTDGVDYQIYVGGALREDGRFTPLYLRNLRLWQLMMTCGLVARAERLKGDLPTPLETTHLVLVQHTPLSIRFRYDEKRFDVDGAYNARYQVVKKRIDKAPVKGTGERVTEPGRIAIVYSQPDEAAEYRDYVEYLTTLGYLTADGQDVELEEVQGVQGLRALRVGVDLGNPRLERRVAAGDLIASA
jgi:hypothetical protein